jgi:ketosteroid isomerase-like protein
MAQNHIQTIKSWYAAFQRNDLAQMLSFLDPHVEWNSAENFIYSDHSPYIGHDAVKTGIYKRLSEDWSEFSMTADEILGAGNLVIARGRFRGTFNANGATVDAQFVQVFQFENDKIAKVQMYTDTAKFKETIARTRQVAQA